MAEEICEHCIFPDLQDNFEFARVDQISRRIRPLTSKDVNIQNSQFIFHRMTSWYSEP